MVFIIIIMIIMVAFSSFVRILGDYSIVHSLPVLFFFFEVEISSHALIPLFTPGSGPIGSAS